ncbi:MAG TPA: hypothetical protein VJT82_07130 [Pyrinomonadaceae bacterium]|nr:hypothetical protein [Pyrinomonadaceae bacterium]
MHKSSFYRARAVFAAMFVAALMLAALAGTASAQTPQARTPTETVREFYKALRERRFRDAFALSIYQPAVEGLSAEEFEELKPEFENLARNLPDTYEISGEQVSGETAEVFTKVGGADSPPTPLIRVNGVWLYGDRESMDIVKREGKEFFPNTRIKVHHDEVSRILQSITAAQTLYYAQHGGLFADLAALMQSKPALREDIEASDTLGYKFRLTLGKDGKSYTVNAEPLRYGRTGRLSFHVYQADINRAITESKDTGGKPFNPSTKK